MILLLVIVKDEGIAEIYLITARICVDYNFFIIINFEFKSTSACRYSHLYNYIYVLV